MKRRIKLFFLNGFAGILFLFHSCRNNDSYFNATADVINGIPIQPADTFCSGKGIIGLVRIPEITCLTFRDTSSGARIRQDFSLALQILLEEYHLLSDSVSSDMPGSIIYSNDTSSFVFEVFIPFKKKPRQPYSGKCILKTLPECVAILCHHQGPYEYLFTSYARIREYMEEYQLMQEGPMREIYFTDPTREPDSSRWITKILVPVIFRK